jgi:fructokinase
MAIGRVEPVQWDVACLGDLVMDLVPHAVPGGQPLLAPSPGGAPGNVAAGLGLLGKKPLMMAKVGDEAFGSAIITALQGYGVDTSGILRDRTTKTRLSVVSHAPDGERSFIFYKDNPADAAVDADDIDHDHLVSASVLHVGSLLMASPRSAAAQAKAVSLARVNGRLVSADPNLRRGLWPDMFTMIAAGRHVVASANVVKLSEEELYVLTGSAPIATAVEALWHSDMKLVAVTKGAEGAELYRPPYRIVCNGFSVNATDTLACGDAFMASLLSGLIDHGVNEDEAVLNLMLRRACAAGAIAATRKGAMSSLPTAAEIDDFLTSTRENAA